MNSLLESKTAILKTTTLNQLEQVMDVIINAGRYQFNYDLDYADNAIIAEMNLQYGMAELLRLAAKRERSML